MKRVWLGLTLFINIYFVFYIINFLGTLIELKKLFSDKINYSLLIIVLSILISAFSAFYLIKKLKLQTKVNSKNSDLKWLTLGIVAVIVTPTIFSTLIGRGYNNFYIVLLSQYVPYIFSPLLLMVGLIKIFLSTSNIQSKLD